MRTQVVWIVFVVFSDFAAWFDVTELRIPNSWNLPGLVGFLVLQIGFGTGAGAMLSVVLTGVLLLVPTLFGVWGQGNWKMAGRVAAHLEPVVSRG